MKAFLPSQARDSEGSIDQWTLGLLNLDPASGSGRSYVIAQKPWRAIGYVQNEKCGSVWYGMN